MRGEGEMGKLVDEVAVRVAQKCCLHCTLDDAFSVKGDVRSVLDEMFEEREMYFYDEGRCEWAACLVPRPQPQPTLAEAARALAERVERIWWESGATDGSVMALAGAVRAALKREGGK